MLDLGLLETEDVIRSLKSPPEGMEIIVTGRGAPRPLVEIADLHSEMRDHRRPEVDSNAALSFVTAGGI